MSIEMQLIAIANFKSVLHKNYLSNLYNFYISLLIFVFHYVVSFLYFILGRQGNMLTAFSALLLECAGSIS